MYPVLRKALGLRLALKCSWTQVNSPSFLGSPPHDSSQPALQ